MEDLKEQLLGQIEELKVSIHRMEGQYLAVQAILRKLEADEAAAEAATPDESTDK